MSEAVRKKRAEGLLILGGVFRRVGAANMSVAEADAMKKHVEETFIRSMAAANGQEM